MRVECPKCEATVHVPGAAEDEILRCPKCLARFRAPEPEDEDDDTPRRSAKGKKKPARNRDRDEQPRKFPIVPVAVVTIVVVVLGWVAAAFVPWGKSNKSDSGPSTSSSTNTTSPPNNPIAPAGGPRPGQPGPMPAGGGPGVQTPPEVAALFNADSGSTAAPTVAVPSLTRLEEGEEHLLTISASRVDRTTGGGTGGPTGGKMTLAEIKAATVYIRLAAGEQSATGSGFLIRADKGTGLIATNFHVVAEAAVPPKGGGPAGKVTVVFESGLPAEAEYAAEVIAFDPEADLAILRVSAPKLPKPIDPRFATAPVELLPVAIYGFPFGQALATGGRSPAITVNGGKVSSLRRDDAGNIEKVQIDGAINPGNSGGPVVTEDGRLVGVAVQTIRGSGIGFAVPAAELISMLDGRVLFPVFLPVETKGGEAAFRVLIPVMDPLKQIKSVTVHVWTGDGEPPAVAKDAAAGWKLTPGAKKLEMPPAFRGLAMAELRLPLGEGSRAAVVQTAITTGSGTVVSPPVRYELKLGSAQTAADAIPLSNFAESPERFAGQVVTVRAKLAGLPPRVRWNYPELTVYDEAGADVSNLVFLTAPDLAALLQEARPPGTDLPVRLTLRVGKATGSGLTMVRVTRADIIGRGDRLLLSIPPTDAPDDQLVALNRNPTAFDGQTLKLDGSLFGGIFGTAQRPQLIVKSLAGTTLSNVQLIVSPEVAGRLRESGLKSSAWYRVRVTGQVQVVPSSAGVQAVVTVTKVEILTLDGKIQKKIE